MPAVGNFTRYAVYNGSDLLDMFRYGNIVTGDLFGIVIVFMAFLVIFMTVGRTRSSKDAFAVSSFTCAIFAILLWIGQVLKESFMIVFVLLLLVGIVTLWMRGDNEQ
jgi:uncharacterized membrane protein